MRRLRSLHQVLEIASEQLAHMRVDLIVRLRADFRQCAVPIYISVLAYSVAPAPKLCMSSRFLFVWMDSVLLQPSEVFQDPLKPAWKRIEAPVPRNDNPRRFSADISAKAELLSRLPISSAKHPQLSVNPRSLSASP